VATASFSQTSFYASGARPIRILWRHIYEEARKEYLPFKAVPPWAVQPAGVYEKEALAEILHRQQEND
jgi:hypothetical protein